MGIISHTWERLPSLSEKDRAELRALAERADSEIDLTDPDCPELTEEQLANGIPNPFVAETGAKASFAVNQAIQVKFVL